MTVDNIVPFSIDYIVSIIKEVKLNSTEQMKIGDFYKALTQKNLFSS